MVDVSLSRLGRALGPDRLRTDDDDDAALLATLSLPEWVESLIGPHPGSRVADELLADRRAEAERE